MIETSIERQRINEHANSMFRFEQLSERWIASCTAYLQALFGETLRGKTVIDYAFGRGNWSLAFLCAGASRVIAIEASSDLVARFQDYCRDRSITNIEVLAGNILEQDFTTKGDLIWLYGILHHIEEPATFLNRIKALASGSDAQIYVYQYNAQSLREFTVQTCRNIIVYQNETEFRKDSFLFVRPARMRARDDLTALRVKFSTACETRDLLRSCGIYVTRRDGDFQQFLHGKVAEEFYPHQFLCSLQARDEVEITEPTVPYAKEVEVLGEIAQEVFSLPLTPTVKTNIAIGLFNTHFAFLREGVYAYDSVIEIFLFLLYVLLQSEVSSTELSPSVAPYYRLFRAALASENRPRRLQLISAEINGNKLTDYLINNNPRS